MSVKSGKKKMNRNQVAMSALTASLLAVAIAPVAYAGNADTGTDNCITTDGSTYCNGPSAGTQDRITFYNWDLAVGSSISSTNVTATSGVPIAILDSLSVGETYTIYTITDANVTQTSTTSVTGEVLLEESGNITGTAGSSSTQTTMWDVAIKEVRCNNTAGCVGGYTFGETISLETGVTGTWTGGYTGTSFTEGAPTPGSISVTPGDGGNLIMTGNGSFGGDLYVNGTIYGGSNVTGTFVPGDLTLHGGTNSTTAVLNDAGVTVSDSTNGTTFTISNNGTVTSKNGYVTGFAGTNASLTYNSGTQDGTVGAADDVILNADASANGGGGGDGIVRLQKNGSDIATFDTNAGSAIDFYANLDMHNNNVSGVNVLTATTGNITTVNSTTVNTSQLNATNANITGTATIGTLNVTGNASIGGNLDMTNGNINNVATLNSTTINNSGTLTTNDAVVNGSLDMTNGNINNVATITATTGNITTINSTTINNSGNITNQGNLVVNGNTSLGNSSGDTLTVAATSTFNSDVKVNDQLNVDTNGAGANVTGTSILDVQTGTTRLGTFNAEGGLNGMVTTNISTVVQGGTGTSTLTLEQNNANLSSGASSSVSLTTNNADMYGYYTSELYTSTSSYVGAYNGYSEIGAQGNYMYIDGNGATFGGEGGPITVTGVANGKAKYDAVNYGQLKDLRDNLSGGIASIAAMNNIPHVDPKKTFAVGIGYGNYDGHSGYAVGGSYRFMEDGILKASVAGSDDGDTAWGVGAGMSW